jgi:hypothetical protein
MGREKNHCFGVFNVWGATIGSLAGIGLGAWLLGPLGVVIVGPAGLGVGVGIATLLAWIFCKDFDGVIPKFQYVTLSGAPQAKVGVPYRVELRWTVQGNTDNLICAVAPKITSPRATPRESPDQSFPNNATDFGRAISQDFVWAQPSDGEPVHGGVVLTVTKNGRSVSVPEARSLTVVVVP